MTREEEIEKAVYNYSKQLERRMNGIDYFNQEHVEYAFIDGIEWADKHPKNEWVSVKDYLPKQDEEVLVLCSELKVAPFYKISFGHIVDKTVCQDYNGWNIPDVVYWFPMPKIPKE